MLLLFALIFATSPLYASPLSQKQSELKAARARLGQLQVELDGLAAKYSKAESRLYEIDDAITRAAKDEERSRQDLDTARDMLSRRVVELYKGRGQQGAMLLQILFEEKDFSAVIERLELLNRVAAQDRDVFGAVKSHLQKVQKLQSELDSKRREQTAKVNELEATRNAMESRLKATSAEYKRLKKQVAALAEEERRQREAIAAANSGKSKNSGGGSRVNAKGFVFPVDGPHSYINDWGFARSGGRSHKGTDIMASRGTPAVACVSGTISRTAYNKGLGGTTIWLAGNNGTSYYYAHLNSIASGIRAGASVRAGQVIGYVGNSGNARGGACHLHFEIHPGGGGAVNPYYTLRAVD